MNGHLAKIWSHIAINLERRLILDVRCKILTEGLSALVNSLEICGLEFSL